MIQGREKCLETPRTVARRVAAVQSHFKVCRRAWPLGYELKSAILTSTFFLLTACFWVFSSIFEALHFADFRCSR